MYRINLLVQKNKSSFWGRERELLTLINESCIKVARGIGLVIVIQIMQVFSH